VSLLYTGLALFVLLAALTARSVWRAWDQRAGQARSAAVFALVQQRMPSRPIEAPGAIAWLREQLGVYRSQLAPSDGLMFERLSDETDRIPSELTAASSALRSVLATPSADTAVPAQMPLPQAGSRRSLSLITNQDRTFVVTRRHGLENNVESNRFIARMLAPMGAAQTRLDSALRGVARPVRLYVLAEDGTLLSLPWPFSGATKDGAARAEATQLASQPALPSFAPEEFFFRFPQGETDAVRYSGFYVDLGGRGVVSTLTMPIEGGPMEGVLALDLAHAVDWDRFASTIAAPLAGTIVRLEGEAPATWSMLRDRLSPTAPASLRGALDAIVTRDGRSAAGIAPITHALVPDVGAVAAFHVSEREWLLAYFPSVAPSFPAAAVALLGVLLVLLLSGFEVNRRRAEREADRAARALAEKQNLLNTMQVPLIVVDPNTDEIVHANQVAESMGIRRGARFADRISAEPRARAHYERTQVATSEARRAYGIPIRIDDGRGKVSEQFVLVRSVAVTAPIEALAADERHRLAILFVVDPQSDLRLLLEDVEADAHTDERRRLAGLLSHGLDALADVLRRSVARADASRSLSPWLAEYLQRRIHVTGWLLDHWHDAPPAHDSVVDAAQVEETLHSLERVFMEVRGDSELRSRLGWTNGPLSSDTGEPPFIASIEWPGELDATLPVRGGLGFFLTEVLANAMRHGAAGTTPRVVVRCDRVRNEAHFAVENERRTDRCSSGGAYGGLALMRGMARLFGWREFSAAPQHSTFVVSWRVPLARRDQQGRPD
jgi:PAS domain-containing protein